MGELEAKSAPKLQRVNGRNLGFDALVAVTHADVRNKVTASLLSKSLKEIRGYFYEEVGVPEGVTPERWEAALARAIAARAAVYKQRFPRAECTPPAMAKWWHQLALPSSSGRAQKLQEALTEKATLDEFHHQYRDRKE